MATTAIIEDKPKQSLWGGGVSPMKASYGKLMMWFFLLSDAFTFAGFLVAYGFVRSGYPSYGGTAEEFIPSAAKALELAPKEMYWPIPEKIFDAFPLIEGISAPLAFVGLMTFILIMSSVTMVLAVEAGHRMDRPGVQKWMGWTVIGGLTFLACQAWEWTHFINGSHKEGWGLMLTDGSVFHGASLSMNEYGPPDFAGFFFFITGFHGFHVLTGVFLNTLIYYNTAVGTYHRRGHYEMVEKVGLYWHFVDLVWVFVFTFFYLV